jgi:type II secretory pathway pseudopilin PulG
MKRASAAGMSLVALAIAGILAVGIATMLTRGMQGGKSTALRQDIEMLKQTVRTRLDCRKTLNVTPATVLPLACGAFGAVGVKNSDGVSYATLGEWTITAGCNGNRLVVRARSPGKDPLTGKDRNSIQTNNVGATVSTDLFGGLSDFCREYFSPGSSCAVAPFTIYRGFNETGALCCRRVNAVGGAPTYVSVAQCAASEYMVQGGGYCETRATGTVQGFLHTSGQYNNSDAWSVDCFRHDDAADATSNAYAICCPK